MSDIPDDSSLENSTDERFSQNKRRAFIIRQLRARGMVSLARLNLQAATPIRQRALEKDIEALNTQGFSIETIESDGRAYLVDAAARHIGSKAQRMDLNAEAKASIGMAACSILLGLPDIPAAKGGAEDKPDPLLKARETLERTNPELGDLLTRKEILSALRQNLGHPEAMDHAIKVYQKLDSLWREASFTAFCDAGTTNEHFARRLTDLLLPSAFSPLRNLSVCSNSRAIFNIIGDPEVPTKAICAGGRQIGIDGLTEAIAGGLTEAFLKATPGILDFAVSFMGTTSIDVGLGYVNSDSWEEKLIKEIVMGGTRSQIRVVVADRSKFTTQPLREGYRFASLQNGQVDLIITNSISIGQPKRDSAKGESSKSGKANQKFNQGKDADEDPAARLIDSVRARGVPVIEIDWRNGPANVLSEMRRGKLFPIRVPAGRMDDLFKETLPALEDEDPLHSPQMGRYLSYPSRALETWVNAALELFTTDGGKNFNRKKVMERFNQLKDKSFFGESEGGPRI